jgi:hypothetical protein
MGSLQTLRLWRPFAYPGLMVLATIVVLILAVWWWIDEGQYSPTCHKIRPDIPRGDNPRGFVEFSLKKLDPIEPTIESEFYLRLNKPPVSPPSEVEVHTSAVGTYLPSSYTFRLERHGSANDAPVHTPGWQKFNLMSREGLHRNFPFDSRSFKFTATFSTDLPLIATRLTNRIPGFYIPCDEASVTWESPRQLGIRFDLERNRLIQLFAVVFWLVAAIFMYIIIFQIQDTAARAASVASYFLSLWSLERLMQDQMHTFPTIFDGVIMVLSILMLVLLTFRITAGQRMQTEGSCPGKGGASDYPPYI